MFGRKLHLIDLTTVAPIFLPLFYFTGGSFYHVVRLVFGTLFPAYYSYKAVRTKNVQEYVKWMMYWIVFAFFTCIETITDVFLSFWFPFYYEIKILVVLWLLSPATKGSSILYRKFVHPWLTKREEEIDDCIAKAKQQGYSTVVQLGTKGVSYATNVIMQTAIKGGGGIVSQLKRSYSANEICEDADLNRNVMRALPSKEGYDEVDDRIISSGSCEPESRQRTESESLYRPRGHSTGRAVRSTKTRSADVSDLYFHDAVESVPQRRSPRNQEPVRYHPMQLYREPPLREQLLRRNKCKPPTRTKSFTVAGSAAGRESWVKAERIEELPETDYDLTTPPSCVSFCRRGTQSFRMRPSEPRLRWS